MNKYTYNIFRKLRSIRKGLPEDPKNIYMRLLESQYWPYERVINYQLDRINRLLSTAKKSSEYYAIMLKDISLPLKSIEEFDKAVPHITKDIIKTHNEKLKTKYYIPNYKHTSSGSTGDPITIFTSGISEAYRDAGLLRFYSWWKISPHENNVLIWGKKATRKQSFLMIEKLKSYVRNRHDINVFDLGPKTIKQYYEKLVQIKPAYIRGFKSGILQLAELIEENRLNVDKLRLKLVVSTAEVLLENERTYMEKVLHCPVANEYGSSDIGQIAFECPHRSMHIYEEAVYVNTNERNEIIATEIYNDSMPLINYRNNDIVILSNKVCTCGRKSRIISRIEGRDEELVKKKDGQKVSPIIFIYIMMELDDIGLGDRVLKWRIVQNQDKYRYYIVPKPGYNKQVEDYIKKRLHEEFGNDKTVEFFITDNIPRDKSGKLRLYTRID
ncbi:MAG: phenylacetate--CoA ligase family protein [Bacillota bacterium]